MVGVEVGALPRGGQGRPGLTLLSNADSGRQDSIPTATVALILLRSPSPAFLLLLVVGRGEQGQSFPMGSANRRRTQLDPLFLLSSGPQPSPPRLDPELYLGGQRAQWQVLKLRRVGVLPPPGRCSLGGIYGPAF